MRRAPAALLALAAALASVLAPTLADAASPAAPHAPVASTRVKGIAVTLAGANEITDARAMVIANELFPMLRSTLHANAVSLNFPFWQNGSGSDEPHRAAMTPSPQRLIALTAVARRYGLTVQWRPYLFEGNLRYLSHNRIQPTSPTRWMASYWTFLRPYLVAASLAGVTSFSIGCEQTSMLKYLSQWVSLVRRARTLYPGALVYSQQHQPQVSIPLTVHGYDAYEPIELASPSQVSAAAFTRGFVFNLRMGAMQSTPADLMLEEVGITATRHAYLAPADYAFGPHVYVDRPVQTDWFEGACNAFWQLHLAGIYYYAIALDRYRPGENDSESIGGWLGTASARAIARCFSRSDAPPPPPRSTSPLTWGRASGVEPSGGHPTSVSCPSASFCVAGDLGGDVVVERVGTWGAPVALASTSITSVSCASVTLCVAVDGAGHAWQFDGATWTAMARVDPVPLTSVSCAVGTASCTAVDAAGQALRLTSGTWGAPARVAPSPLTSVSCPTPSDCVAVDASGDVLAYAGRWSRVAQLGQASLTALDCPTVTTCLAGDDAGRLYRSIGDGWRPLRTVVPGGVTAVACETATICDVLGPDGAVLLAGGNPVGGAAPFPDDTATAASCAPEGTCTAVSFGGDVAAGTATWSTPSRIDAGPGALTGVSCGTPTFCVAVDDAGAATTWDGVTWSARKPTGLPSASAVSCAGTFCVAVSGDGSASTFAAGAWGRPRAINPSSALTSVSCVSSSFCMAADASNRVLAFNGRSWTRPTTEGVFPFKLRGYTGIACGSPTFCVAVDTHGYVLQISQGSARLIQVDVGYLPFTGVSCASASFCVAVDEQGRVLTYVASARRKWSIPMTIDTHRLTAVSCTSTSFCLAVDDSGGTVAYVNGKWGPVTTSVPLARALSAVSCTGTSTCVATDASDVTVGT